MSSTSSTTVSRQQYFSEDNLFMLLNIIHDTIDDPLLFDSGASKDRQKLFEIMTRVYRGHDDLALNDINKLVLRNTYRAVRQSPSISKLGASHQAMVTDRQPNIIRDADVNQRPPPVHFEERPQQAFVRKHSTDVVSLDNAMQTLQNDRQTETRAAPDTIDFRLKSGNGGEEDNRVVMDRLQATEALRKTDVATLHDTSNATPTDTTHLLSNALQEFDHTNSKMNERVEAATVQKDDLKNTRENAFQQNTQLRESTYANESSIINGASIDVHDLPEFGTLLTEEAGLRTTALNKLDVDVQVSQAIENTKMDEKEFQHALHLSKEENALQTHLSTSVAGVQEELLIPYTNQYRLHTNHLEVCSNDRVRTLPTSETVDTPYSFTLYFNSNRPSYRVYPIYENHPIEEPDEYTAGDTDCKIKLDTLNVRQCAGLRGYPKCDGMPDSSSRGITSFDTSALSHYETVQLSDVAGPNVDTVFYNVMSIQTNHVQIYYPHDYAPKYPYIVLEIEQFSNVYKSSNTLLRKSFCKLFYDRSSSPTLSNSQYHLYTPLNQEKKEFLTPLANIDRLTFKLYNSFGNPLDTIQDVLHVKAFYMELSGTPSTSYIYILLHDYISVSYVSVDNHITFEKCLEWYHKEWYDNWMTEIGSVQCDKQEAVERDYYEKLLANRGKDNETLKKLKEEFTRKQITFDYPSVGYPVESDFSELRDYLQRDDGHTVVAVGTYDSTVIPAFVSNETSPTDYINAICIKMPTIFNTTTGTSSLQEFGGNNTDLNTKLLSDNYPLMTGTLLNNSVCTNISMSVVTRDEDNRITSQNV